MSTYTLPPFSSAALARIKARYAKTKPRYVSYTFSVPSGTRGRPRHVTFSSYLEAAAGLGLQPHTVNALAGGNQKRAANGVRFVSRVRKVRPTNVALNERGLGKVPVTLQHIESGRKLSAASITAFCRKAGFKGGTPHFHITPILKGERLSYKGWGRPDVLNQRLKLKDAYGNTYEPSVAELILNRVGAFTIRRLQAGQQVGAIAPATVDTSHTVPPNPTKVTRYRFHMGEGAGRGNPTVVADTIKGAATRLGISPARAGYLVHGLAGSVKGATFLGAETTQRRVLELAAV